MARRKAKEEVNQDQGANNTPIMVPFTKEQINGLMGYLYESDKGIKIFLDLDKQFNQAIKDAEGEEAQS